MDDRKSRDLPETFVSGFHDEDAVRKMRYRKLGNTGLQVSIIGFGGADFGSLYFDSDESACTRALHCAIKSGINYIDTAPFYNDSEVKMGKALKGIPRESYYIGTKVGRYMKDEKDIVDFIDFSYENTLRSVDESLKKLGLQSVDLIQVHDFEFAKSADIIINETLPALQKVKESGKTRFIGINGYPFSIYKEILERSTVKIDTILSFNRLTMVDSSLTEHLAYFESKGVGVINASPFAAGLLIDRSLPMWHFAKLPQYKFIADACQQALSYCKEHGVDLAKLALRHSLNLSSTFNIAINLVGMSSLEQLDSNLRCVYRDLTEDEEKIYQEVMEKFMKPLRSPHWEDKHLEHYKSLYPDVQKCWWIYEK